MSAQKNLLEREATAVESFASAIVWLFGIAVAGTIFVVGWFGTTWHWSFGTTREHWGVAGDFIGGVLNPVLSFVSLMALLLTVVMQRQQLRLGREELHGSQAELERSREIQSRMADAMTRQAQHAMVSTRIAALGAALTVISKEREELSTGVEGESPYKNADRAAIRLQESKLLHEILRLTETIIDPESSAAQM